MNIDQKYMIQVLMMILAIIQNTQEHNYYI